MIELNCNLNSYAKLEFACSPHKSVHTVDRLEKCLSAEVYHVLARVIVSEVLKGGQQNKLFAFSNESNGST